MELSPGHLGGASAVGRQARHNQFHLRLIFAGRNDIVNVPSTTIAHHLAVPFDYFVTFGVFRFGIAIDRRENGMKM